MEGLRKKKHLPVNIVEQHNDVVPFIHRAIASRLLPFAGIPVIHLDSHPDLLIPIDLQADAAFQPQDLYESLSIENWLIPLVFAKHVDYVAWVKPPWANQIQTPKQELLVGKCCQSGKMRLTSKENYFLTEGLFRPEKELLEQSNLTLQVIEVKPDKWNELDSSYASTGIDENNPINSTVQPPSPTDSLDKTQNLADSLHGKPYILDIDLDFFSTANPFRNFLNPAEEKVLRQLYHYPPLKDTSDEAAASFTKDREEQLNYLEIIFTLLEETFSPENLTQSKDVAHCTSLAELTGRKEKDFEYFSPKQQTDLIFLCNSLLKQRGEREVTFLQVHDFGCTLDDTELPHHISTSDQIQALYVAVKDFLGHLPKPAIVTIARSCEDGYCPPDVVNQCQAEVLKLLEELFGTLEVNRYYEQS